MQQLVAVHREPGGVTVALRPYRRWRNLGVPVVVACTGLIVLLVVLRSGARVPAVVPEVLLGVTGLAAWAASSIIAWHLLGREVVTATPEALTIERFIIRRRSRRQYAPGRVVNLRAQPAGPVMHRGRLVSAPAALAFDYEGRTVRFGAGLAGARAQALVVDLDAAMNRPSTVSA